MFDNLVKSPDEFGREQKGQVGGTSNLEHEG
jgi:hypothetical protein